MDILNSVTASTHGAADEVEAAEAPTGQWHWLEEGESPNTIGEKLLKCLGFALAAGLLISLMHAVP